MRKDIFDLISLFGGTEIIYVSDDRYPKITYFDQIYEGMSYEAIKAELIQTLGAPVTDYRAINEDIYTPNDIKEFLLDDFADIKREYEPFFSTGINLRAKYRKANKPMNLTEETLNTIAFLIYQEHIATIGARLNNFLDDTNGLTHLNPEERDVADQGYFLRRLKVRNFNFLLEEYLLEYFSPLKFQDRMHQLDQYIATLNPLFREEGWFILREDNTLIILDIKH